MPNCTTPGPYGRNRDGEISRKQRYTSAKDASRGNAATSSSRISGSRNFVKCRSKRGPRQFDNFSRKQTHKADEGEFPGALGLTERDLTGLVTINRSTAEVAFTLYHRILPCLFSLQFIFWATENAEKLPEGTRLETNSPRLS